MRDLQNDFEKGWLLLPMLSKRERFPAYVKVTLAAADATHFPCQLTLLHLVVRPRIPRRSRLRCRREESCYAVLRCDSEVCSWLYWVSQGTADFASFPICVAGVSWPPEVEACTKTDDTYTLSGCQPFRHCVAPVACLAGGFTW